METFDEYGKVLVSDVINKKEFVMFDEYGVPVGITIPVGDYPAQCTLARWGAASAKLMSRCSRQEYEDARRAMRDSRIDQGPRRHRSGGHGYKGGTGFKSI